MDHARSAVGMAGLPLNMPVEIEAEGEVGVRVHTLAQGRRGLHEPRVAIGGQRLQEESRAPAGVFSITIQSAG